MNNQAGSSLKRFLEDRLRSCLSNGDQAVFAQLAHDFDTLSPGYVDPKPTDVTVLMADLRGFSSLANSLEPDTLVQLLQSFLKRMTEVIHEHGGFIDKFMGDGIMALFGAPNPTDQHALQAARCAAQMQREVDKLNGRHALRKLPALFMGVGVNSGRVMAGCFGSEEYKEYTVVGDTVNLAARMEKFALRGEVLLSESSCQAAKEKLSIGNSRELRVRGQGAPVMLHSLEAVAGEEKITVPDIEQRQSPRVPVELPLVYHTVENQQVLPETHEGLITNIGYGGMLAELPLALPVASEITFAIS
ncbi:MAG: adenylate/guanylate cyclase domain-containing protein, partial [Pseudomonadota bacterium]